LRTIQAINRDRRFITIGHELIISGTGGFVTKEVAKA
jgi:hypothetical protein